ncbi:glycosyl hydrolase 115 family protein [Salinimicrobium sp. HB62]|uniref:glycosyl hydrolase 115 family protein n=1 Tax=Salinimicrobium sp. HB62 TaxID=3077781 RepID=UPI002D78690A|nr:glycosyl hydrolase 115 family protein [Salinimicrobium sp. HB62]
MRRLPFSFSAKKPVLLGLLLVVLNIASVGAQESFVTTVPKKAFFPLVSEAGAATVYVAQNDYKGVHRVAQDFVEDVERVTGKLPALKTGPEIPDGKPVIIGTLGKSTLIDDLVDRGKLDISEIEGKWETFSIQTVERPFPGVDQALVIVGSDKRGTIFGIYDVSEEIGVSPWYYWADVPADKAKELYIKPGKFSDDTPKVKYRGIFINDEAPALSGWAGENFGGFNSKFYEHVFELILRLKGNYLWPAMWGRAFYDNDPINAELADEYGVVIGTSHHEPLMRAHDEWRRYGKGAWDYNKNPKNLREFWRGGIERMGDNESVVTIGMRGDGDEPMSEDTAVELLETIVKDQREIIADVTGKPSEETPQVWALYKEVQDYYDQGMRVPDDVTLLLADDNWGNIRKLPNPKDERREGGYGIYYHYDYVGGPRNYKWINTTQISRVWEQMNLAYRYGADELWMVNVGDIKPMEFPISFFLDYAWDPEKISADDLKDYTVEWSKKQFNEQFSEEIAGLLLTYTKYNSRRKPELIGPETYSLTNFNEAERIVEDYNNLVDRAEKVYAALEEEYKDAFYQLVLFPVKASANLNELYVAAAKNRLYSQQGRAATNRYAERVKVLFEKDAALTKEFHTDLADGKWNHMMSQTHIGYTYWQQPEQNNMPEVEEIHLPKKAKMGIALEGSEQTFPTASATATLPVLDPYNDQSYYIEIFNKGKEPFNFNIRNRNKWLEVSEVKGTVDDQSRIYVKVNWDKVPKGKKTGTITVHGAGESVEVEVPINNFRTGEATGFVERNNYIAIEAANFSENVQKNGRGWELIPNLGRTGSAMAAYPNEPVHKGISKENPYLAYNIFTTSGGEADLELLLSPTLDYLNKGGLKLAVSLDDKQLQMLNMHENTPDDWSASVSNNVTRVVTKLDLGKPGAHTLKIWAVETGPVLQKIILKTGEVKESYLGPPESAKTN